MTGNGREEREELARAARLEMVESQLRRRGIADPSVLRAFETVPRERFVPPGTPIEDAFADRPVAIGDSQTVSQPYVVALMLQVLDVAPGHRALEVGAGSGYASALLAALGARVIAVERLPRLVERARENLARAGFADRVDVRVGDGSAGLPGAGPFDRILVSAAAPAVPRSLVRDLAAGGVLVAPIGGESEQELIVVRRTPSGDRESKLGKCAFVKLYGAEGFSPEPP